jgi:hypothetical protein
MIAACGILAISTGACSSLLGIDDPKPDQGDGGVDDDGPSPGAESLTLSLTDVKIAQSQRVHFRVTAVYAGGKTEDATGSATYESNDAAVAAVGAPGQLDAGTKAGSATITARFGDARAATMTVTVSTKTCQPVINELQTAGTSSSADEWIEILNPCKAAVNVAGWTLVYRSVSATTDSATMITLAGSMQPHEFRLYTGPAYGGSNEDGRWSTGGGTGQLAEGSGAVALRIDTTTLADSVAYGTAVSFIETNPLPAMAKSRPAARQPYDGHDEDDATKDFVVAPVVSPGTPRTTNAP